MGTLTLQRHHLPFWPTAALAVIAWLIAWFAAWPASQWLAFELLGLEHDSALGEVVASSSAPCRRRHSAWSRHSVGPNSAEEYCPCPAAR